MPSTLLILSRSPDSASAIVMAKCHLMVLSLNTIKCEQRCFESVPLKTEKVALRRLLAKNRVISAN